MDAHFAVVGVNERMRTSLCLLKRMLSWSTVNWNDVRLFGGTRVNSSQHFDAVGADALPPRFFEWDSSLYRKADEDSQSKRLRMDVAGPNCSHTTTANQYVRPQVLMAWVTGQGWLGRGST